MCDFRIVEEIKFIDTGELIKINLIKQAHWQDGGGVDNGNGIHVDWVTEPGFYSIAASGSYHMYYDGNKWFGEGEDYIVTKSRDIEPPYGLSIY